MFRPFCRLCTWIKGQGLAASREFVPATQMLRALDVKVRIKNVFKWRVPAPLPRIGRAVIGNGV